MVSGAGDQPNVFWDDLQAITAEHQGAGASPNVAYVGVGASSLPTSNMLPATIIGWRRGYNNMLNGVRPAKVLCVGDSTTRGYGQGVDGVGWPGDVAPVLNGRGFSTAKGLCIPEFNRLAQTADPRIAYGANWSLFGSLHSGEGWGSCNPLWQGAVGAGALTFTPGTACDRFDIYWFGYVANHGTVQASIDGQAATAINTSGQAAAGIYKTTVTATNGVQTNHVLSLANVTLNNVFICGIEAYNGTTPQVVIGNAGVNSSFASGSGGWNVGGSAALNQGPLDCIKAYNPDLSLIMLGVNDANSLSASSATVTAAITGIGLACANGGGSVILMSPLPEQNTQAGYGLLAGYQTALASLAATNGWGFIDIFNRWGGNGGYATLNPLGWYFDSVHPDQVGYWDIATTVATALMAI